MPCYKGRVVYVCSVNNINKYKMLIKDLYLSNL